MENRVLIITNDATKSFAPDIIQVRFTYEDLRDTYDSASEEAAKCSSQQKVDKWKRNVDYMPSGGYTTMGRCRH